MSNEQKLNGTAGPNRNAKWAAQDRYNARWAYEQFLIQQPHIVLNGLWFSEEKYFIACDQYAQQTALDGRPLKTWFEHSCQPIVCPIYLTDSPPPSAEAIRPRTPEEIATLVGAPLTIGDCCRELGLRLRRDFPKYTLSFNGPHLIAVTANQVSPADQKIFVDTVQSINPVFWVEFTTTEIWEKKEKPETVKVKNPDALTLISSRTIPEHFCPDVRWRLEADEDFWTDNRVAILAEHTIDPARCLPKRFRTKESKCLINASVYLPENLRSYIALFEHVLIQMPLDHHYEAVLKAMKVTVPELVELARRGRVSFILPQTLARYHSKLLNELATNVPDSLLLTRRLAAATVVDGRRRFPLLYPAGSIEERHNTLRDIAECLANAKTAEYVKPILTALSHNWFSGELLLHRRGAMANVSLGLGSLIGPIANALLKKDVQLELMMAGIDVEWAATLGASVFPNTVNGYTDSRPMEVVANLYSPVPLQPVHVNFAKSTKVVQDLFTIDNDAPILEVADVFKKGDLARGQALVARILSSHLDQEEVRTEISRVNAAVRKYERRLDRIPRLQVLASTALFASIVGLPIQYASASALIVNFLLQAAPKGRFLGPVFDRFRSIPTQSRTDVVLVSRLRREMKSLRQ
jgi:hypothetical protein